MSMNRKSERQTVLLLDADQELRSHIRHISRRNNVAIYSAMNFLQASRMLAMRDTIKVVLVGVYANQYEETVKGLEMIQQARPDLSVVALVEKQDLPMATQLMKEDRVFRYIQKPIKDVDLIRSIRASLKQSQLLKRVGQLDKSTNISVADSKPSLFSLRSFMGKSA